VRTPNRITQWLLSAAALGFPFGLAAQAAPTNVTAVDTKGAVTISWTGVRTEVTYRVLRALDQKSPGQDLTRPLAPGTISYLDSGVTPGTTYFYQVVAVYGDGTQGASLPIQYLTPALTAPIAIAPTGTRVISPLIVAPPPAPTGLSITGTPAEATLLWQPMSGVSSIVATRKQANVADLAITLAGTAASWNDKGLRPGTAYTYVVNAFYADGRSASAQVPFTSPPAINPPAASAVAKGVGEVQLSWQLVSGASYYIVLGPGSSNGGVKVSGSSFLVTGAPVGPQVWSVGTYYDPGPIAAGTLVGPNAVSTPATQFTKVPFTVAAAPVITAHHTSFDPQKNGFYFTNDFKNSFIGPPFNVATGGLCGGMSYTVLDYYLSRMQLSTQPYRPANNTTLQQYFYGRQVTSLQNNLDKWGELSLNPGGSRNAEFFNWGLTGRLTELKSFIDRGAPVPLGLKGLGGMIAGDHQVLAIGYDLGRYGGALGAYQTDVKIYLMDPNHPRETVTLVPNPSTLEWYELEYPEHRWRSYFVDGKYAPMSPPNIPNPVYAADGLIHELWFNFLTGLDDMRGGADHVNVTLSLADGTSQVYQNISQNGIWLVDYEETARVVLTQPISLASFRSFEVSTNATGGLNGDNWALLGVQVTAMGGGFVPRDLLTHRSASFTFTGARKPFVVDIK
jgi:hypothetical protein